MTKNQVIEAEVIPPEALQTTGTQHMAASPVQINLEVLIDKALAANANIEVIERLAALYEKQRAQWAKEQFTKALSKFKSECPKITKGKPVFKKSASPEDRAAFYDNGDMRGVQYLYAPLEDIQAVADPHLAENGFSYSFKNVVNAKDKELTSICLLSHVSGHTEPSDFTVPIGSDYMSKQQEFGSARSFAKRYAFLDATGLQPAGEDNDGAGDETERKPRGGADHRFKEPTSKSERKKQRTKAEETEDAEFAVNGTDRERFPNIKAGATAADKIQSSNLRTLRSNMQRLKLSEQRFEQTFGLSLADLDKRGLNELLDWIKEQS